MTDLLMTATPALTTIADGDCCAPLAGPTISVDEAEATAALFKALADPDSGPSGEHARQQS